MAGSSAPMHGRRWGRGGALSACPPVLLTVLTAIRGHDALLLIYRFYSRFISKRASCPGMAARTVNKTGGRAAVPCAAAGQVNFCGRMRFGVAATAEADTSKSQIGSEEEIPSGVSRYDVCI